jgi:hypothetical protein
MFGRNSFKAEDLENISLFEENGKIKCALIFEDDLKDMYFALYENI